MTTNKNTDDLLIIQLDKLFKNQGVITTAIGGVALFVNIHALLTTARKVPMLTQYVVMFDKIPLIGSILGFMKDLPPFIVDIVGILTAKLGRYLSEMAALGLTLAYVLTAILAEFTGAMGVNYLNLIQPIVAIVMIILRMDYIPIASVPLGTTLLQYDTIILLLLCLIKALF